MILLRIQRKRTRGWKMPKGAICVDRPSIWGNPFPVEEYGRELCIRLYREMFYGWDPTLLRDTSLAECRVAYQRQRAWKQRFGNDFAPLERARIELCGHDLAAWCPLCPVHVDGKPLDVECADCTSCHADPLGVAANA